jgi:hypothetical protein
VTSKRRLREQLYIAEAERDAWYEAWREAVQNQCVCRVDNAPTEQYKQSTSKNNERDN